MTPGKTTCRTRTLYAAHLRQVSLKTVENGDTFTDGPATPLFFRAQKGWEKEIGWCGGHSRTFSQIQKGAHTPLPPAQAKNLEKNMLTLPTEFEMKRK